MRTAGIPDGFPALRRSFQFDRAAAGSSHPRHDTSIRIGLVKEAVGSMFMAAIAAEDVTDAPLEKVFGYLADSRNIEQWFYGVERIVPLTEQIRGLGSTFEITINAGIPLKAKIKCTEFVENELIVVTSLGGDGPAASTRWTFASEGDGTRIRGEFDYTVPGGLAGAAMATLVKPFAAIAVKQTTANILRYAGR